jgi:hypothetical protein
MELEPYEIAALTIMLIMSNCYAINAPNNNNVWTMKQLIVTPTINSSNSLSDKKAE